ncbi:erythromycin esterase family protein [Mucilaginibacter pedocola]|uniref:Erythromycin esterase n=1 Tax=Mucilaginibacter pedocola TaxID=1792845 RepID=A0A1S9PGL3_9SPHI|nr:erythromycin esterase family protein [Mucilaginibacter pedocola]OOQ60094.1 hypothetical protein BC343_26575 [Mucilaginibacter pedocola]
MLYRLHKLKLMVMFCAVLLFAMPVRAQKLIRSYVDTATKTIATIEPDSVNYSDLEVIGNAIGNKRVVMLGEQDHGDAPTFLAKTRLIKYLHEKKGFNVLAFEADFYGLNEGWDKLDKNKPAISKYLLQNIFPIWTLCNTCETLFYKYIPGTYQTPTPLLISGFDSQQYLGHPIRNLNKNLDSLLRANDLPITKQPNYVDGILPLIDSSKRWGFKKPATIGRVNECLEALRSIRAQLEAKLDGQNVWLLVIDNLIQQAKGIKFEMETGKPDLAGRDAQMAINLKWLIEHKFKGEKIIVWAASYHIARSLENVDASIYRDKKTMGAFLAETLNAPGEVYNLGFASYEGTGGRIYSKGYKVSTRNKNSLEAWLNAKGYKFAFTDFNNFNKQFPTADEKFPTAALGHYTTTGLWNKVFDGIFFIRDTYRCEKLEDPLKVN